jgi:integrase
MKAPVPIKRGAVFQLRRRVPKRYASVEPRADVLLSLHTDSASVARTKAVNAWAALIDGWEAKLLGRHDEGDALLAEAREICDRRGFRYLNAERVAALPEAEFVARLRAAARDDFSGDLRAALKGEKHRPKVAPALLGGVAEPVLTVSRALDAYWALAADRTRGKSPDQIRRWRNPKKKAIANFVAVVGDRPLNEISPDDVLAFRQWWVQRVKDENLTPGSANTELGHFGDVLRTVNRMKRLGLSLPLGDLGLKGDAKSSRPPFSDSWIKTRLLAPGALDGTNVEARNLLRAMVNTGARPSELAGLLPEHIRLDAEIPHISIEPIGRQLKTATSRRVIPLVGVSLEAFRQCPRGFERYRGRDATAAINKFMKENGLMETPSHSLYSLRHAFEDRMLAAGIDERIRRDLMGHALGGRQRYGAGATLAHKFELLKAIAL